MEICCDIDTDGFKSRDRTALTHTAHTLHCLRAGMATSHALSPLITLRSLRENVIPTGTEKEAEAQRGSTFVQCNPAYE